MIPLVCVLIVLVTVWWDLRYGDTSCETPPPSPR